MMNYDKALKCKLCHETKDQDEFYKTGSGGRERVCKQCTGLVNRALRAYTKWAPRDRSEWPSNFLTDVRQIATYVQQGGTPPQRIKVTSMLKHLDFDMPEVSTEVSVEAFMFLLSRVDELEAKLADLTRPSGPGPKLHTQWADAMAKVDLPMTDDDLLAWKGAMSKLKAAISYGQVVTPTIIRDIVVPLEVDLIPWPDSCMRIYDSYIAPALDAATQQPNYAELSSELVDLTSRNYYELKWPLIPYDALNEDSY